MPSLLGKLKGLMAAGPNSAEEPRRAMDGSVAVSETSPPHEPRSAAECRALAEGRWRKGNFVEAGALYLRAHELEPRDAAALVGLGDALFRLGRRDQALGEYAKALAINSQAVASAAHRSCYGDALGERAIANRSVCDWSRVEADEQEVIEAVRERGACLRPTILLFLRSTSRDQYICARRQIDSLGLRAIAGPSLRARENGRIRLGYVSGTFREHAVAFLIAELFERHDRGRFEVRAYSIGPDDDGPMRARMRSGVDDFVDIGGLPAADAAARIRADGVDIAIDLMGHMEPNAMDILRRHPAPIQVAYLGYPGTTGADWIDYVLADRHLLPITEQRNFSERIVQLPHCYQPNDRMRPIAERVPTRVECGLPERGFVFCCFNAPVKLTPEFFAIWMRLLRAVPESVLWLLDSAAPDLLDQVRANLRREASAREVDPARVVFAPRTELPAHLARHRLADLFLDTLPYGAHTTMSDALWAGLPAITCLGETFAGRVGASLLHAAGLGELVTRSPQEYESLAMSLAADPARLAAIRDGLRRDRLSLPLFDTPRFARGIEAAYARMWERACRGMQPEPFAVAPPGGA